MLPNIPQNIKGKELFDYLVKNKAEIIRIKRANIKESDSIMHPISLLVKGKEASFKSASNPTLVKEVEDEGTCLVKVVANSAWWCDSQMDVLTDGCYDKSIKEKGVLIPHIADHCHKSTNHVGDVQAVYKQQISLKDLGLDMNGKTTALVFETLVREDYNEDTYKFYKNGKINQHSIGLMYISLGLCINNKDYLPEFELWGKYYDKVINKDVVDEAGYFWIVPEIKVLENSCVLFGSNELTPTLEVISQEPPEDGTQGKSNENELDTKSIITNFKFKLN